MFFELFFAHENMKKMASKVIKPAQIQPKSQFLFLKHLPMRDFFIMTLTTTIHICSANGYANQAFFLLFSRSKVVMKKSSNDTIFCLKRYWVKGHRLSKIWQCFYSRVRNRSRAYGYQFSIFFQALRPY